MKNRNRLCFLTAILVILLFTIPLTGCQLAQETSTINKNTEILCGVFVTIGSASTLMEERNLEENNSEDLDFSVNNNGEVTFDDEKWASLYNCKVEGVLSDNGASIQFSGIDGYYMGILQSKAANGDNQNTLMGDNGLHDTKFSVNSTDEGEERSCESTLSLNTEIREVIYVNPVYQRGDGTYYTIIGQQMGFMISYDSSGQVFSQTLDNAITRMDNGTTSFEKDSFKINVAIVDEAKQISIKEMSQNDELIKVTEYLRDDPEKFLVDRKTKYVIVEEVMYNDLKGNYVKRSIYSIEQKPIDNELVTHPCSFAEDNGVIGLKSIEFAY